MVQTMTLQVLVRDRLGQIRTRLVDDEPQQGRRQEAPRLEMGRGLALRDIERLEQQTGALETRVADDRQGRGPEIGGAQKLHRSAHHRVLAGHEFPVLMRECGAPIEGQGQALFGQLGEGLLEHVRPRANHQCVARRGLVLDTETVPEALEIVGRVAVRVGPLDRLDQGGGALRTVRVQLEKTIAPRGQLGIDARAQRAGLRDQGVGVLRIRERRHQVLAQPRVDGRCGRTDSREGMQPLGIPTEQHLARTAGEIGDMDLHPPRLPDPIETPDALLEQVGIQRQIEQHQMMGELEVAPLAADLRAEQDLGAVLR